MADSTTITGLQQLRDSLLGDLAQGVATIKDQNGEEISYSSPAQILLAINELERRISSLQNNSRTRPAGIYSINTSSGL